MRIKTLSIRYDLIEHYSRSWWQVDFKIGIYICNRAFRLTTLNLIIEVGVQLYSISILRPQLTFSIWPLVKTQNAQLTKKTLNASVLRIPSPVAGKTNKIQKGQKPIKLLVLAAKWTLIQTEDETLDSSHYAKKICLLCRWWELRNQIESHIIAQHRHTAHRYLYYYYYYYYHTCETNKASPKIAEMC